MNTVGLNNKLLVKPYGGKTAPTAEVKSGFATVKQRSRLVGLELIADALVVVGGTPRTLESGKKVYFLETELATAQWTKLKMTSENIEGEFLIADFRSVIAIDD